MFKLNLVEKIVFNFNFGGDKKYEVSRNQGRLDLLSHNKPIIPSRESKYLKVTGKKSKIS